MPTEACGSYAAALAVHVKYLTPIKRIKGLHDLADPSSDDQTDSLDTFDLNGRPGTVVEKHASSRITAVGSVEDHAISTVNGFDRAALPLVLDEDGPGGRPHTQHNSPNSQTVDVLVYPESTEGHGWTA